MKQCVTMLVLMFLLLVLAVVLIDRSPTSGGLAYADALASSQRQGVVLPEGGPQGHDEVFGRFRSMWGNLDTSAISNLFEQVYAEEVWFNDTLKTIEGLPALRHYLEETANRVTSCRVEVQDIARSGENYYVRWSMHVVPLGSDPGSAWKSIGVTHLRFNQEGRVVIHQDYWDAAAGLYEHLPVVGWIIRNIKARL